VKIEVFDILGRKVCTLLPEQPKRAGTYSIAWSGKNEHGYPAASGVYFARFIAKDNSKATSKIIVEKLLLLR
jgi:flagellar hook assembly protein FlgD